MMKKDVFVFGFSDDVDLARAAGRSRHLPVRIASQDAYRSGELALRVDVTGVKRAVIAASVGADPSEAFRVVVLAHALREAGVRRVELIAPWIAYGRQDRAVPEGVGAGLVLARMLADAFDRIVTLDAHSDAFLRAFRGQVKNVLPDPRRAVKGIDVVVAPDEGSRARARAMSSVLGKSPLVLHKVRTKKGVRSAFSRPTDAARVHGAKVLLVDDLADTGGTLVAAAREVLEAGAVSVRVHVTHAVDLAALRESLRPFTADVEAAYDHASGKVAAEHLSRAFAAASV